MKQKSLNAKNKIHKSILENLNNFRINDIFKEFKKTLNVKDKIAVAVSGGPDSLALAFLAQCFSLLSKVNVKFYLVNHRLREGSSTEAKLVIKKLKNFGINCKILSWHGKKPKTNIQAIARKKRYSLLTEQCKKDKINYILLGHHLDDLYENFFIRLSRGTGLKGLTSFGKISDHEENNVKFLRPLLNLDKKELAYISLKVFNFFIKDPSNLNENFKRVRIRNLINTLEKEGLDKKKFLLTIDNLKDSDKSVNFYVERNLKFNTTFYKSKNTYILSKSFFKNPHEIIFRSLSHLMKLVSKNYYPPRGKSIKNLILKIELNEITKVTLGGCYIEKINESVIISSEK
jgi:tRNA(Ile)-lysidine synthase